MTGIIFILGFFLFVYVGIQSWKFSYLKSEIHNRYYWLKGQKRKDYHMASFAYLYHASKPFDRNYYLTNDLKLLKMILKVKKVEGIQRVVDRIIKTFFILIISGAFHKFKPHLTFIPYIPFLAVLLCLINDLITIFRSSILTKKSKVFHILFSVFIPLIYGGIIHQLYREPKGIKVIQKRIEKLQSND